jgi:Rps23 Pro-64 3,4-dihydroxylase Tpa1-like proline 4-hydroxylase
MTTAVTEIPARHSAPEERTAELLSDAYATHLRQLARDRAHEYRTNQPFPNIYFDDFLPKEIAEAALRDFPEPKQLRWSEFDDRNQAKLAFDSAEKLPASIRNILYFFNSRPMLEFLEILTGINGLIPDPYFVGGGLHQIKPGGFLEVHADFNRHSKLKLDRRLNVLLYLNKDWKEEYGGHFELWNRDMSASVRKILPVFNRMAMFTTTSTSYHGHPTPLSCPPDRTRKSIAVYYYSNGRPEEEKREGHDTLFQEREGSAPLRFRTFRSAIRALVPPILRSAVSRNRKV